MILRHIRQRPRRLLLVIPDNGVVHACYGNNGSLRVFDPSAGDDCRNNAVDLLTPAGKAANAGHADTAGSAADAAQAANADNLDGKDSSAFLLACPAGTERVADFCTETTLRGATFWNSASSTCSNAGRHLPNVETLKAAWNAKVRFSMSGSLQQLLSSDWAEDQVLKAPSASSNQFNLAGTAAFGDQHQYFCVVAPSQP